MPVGWNKNQLISLVSLVRDEMAWYGMRYIVFAVVGSAGLMLGILLFGRGYKKRIKALETAVKDLNGIKATLAAMQTHPIINFTQQVAVHGGGPPNEEGHYVMSSTIKRIEAMPQADFDQLEKTAKDTVYLTT